MIDAAVNYHLSITRGFAVFALAAPALTLHLCRALVGALSAMRVVCLGIDTSTLALGFAACARHFGLASTIDARLACFATCSTRATMFFVGLCIGANIDA